MTGDPRPIRPEAVELLRRRIDAESLSEAMEAGTLDVVTAPGGQLLEPEERELLDSVTPAELRAAVDQTEMLLDMHVEWAVARRERVELLEPVLALDDALTDREAYSLLSADDRAKAIQLDQRIDELALLLDPMARTAPEVAEAYLVGRIVVVQRSDDGEPTSYREVEADPERSPPTLAEATRVLAALVGDRAAGMLARAPEAWQRAWDSDGGRP